MGSEEQKAREVQLAEGVYKRVGKSGKESLRIAFMFRGVSCRERLTLDPTLPNIRYAVNLRGEILNAIGRGTFNYADYFPESENARRFGFVVGADLVGDELRIWFKEARLAESTRRVYQAMMDRYLFPWFDPVRLRDLTAPMIRSRLLGVRMTEGGIEMPVTLKTARNIIAPLGSMLERAVGDGKIESNPLARVKLELYWPENRTSSEWEADPFSFDEMTAIFGKCGPEEGDYWRFAFGTGMRPSEQIELRWPRVDLVHLRARVEVARVIADNTGRTAVKPPKTRAGKRDIDLTAGAWEALQRQMERTRLAGAHVFLDPATGRPWRSDERVRRRWAAILKLAGVRYRNPYQTRHTFASALLAAGWPELQVAKWMGHTSVEPLRRSYARWIEQGADPASRGRLDAFFSHASPAVRNYAHSAVLRG